VTEKAPEHVESDADPNDNTIGQEDADEATVRDDDKELSEYENLRKENIRELEALKRKVGLVPHSKEWEVEEWEDLF